MKKHGGHEENFQIGFQIPTTLYMMYMRIVSTKLNLPASQLTSWRVWELDTERLQVSWLVPALGSRKWQQNDWRTCVCVWWPAVCKVMVERLNGWTQRTQKKIFFKHGWKIWKQLRMAGFKHWDMMRHDETTELTELLGPCESPPLYRGFHPPWSEMVRTGIEWPRMAMNSHEFTISTRRIRKGSKRSKHVIPYDTCFLIAARWYLVISGEAPTH